MFKTQGTKYQVLPNFGICCRELGGLKVASFCACVRSFCSVTVDKTRKQRTQKYTLWKAFLNVRVWDNLKRRLRVDANRKRIRKYVFTDVNIHMCGRDLK